MALARALCGDVEVAYETFGSPHDPTIMLIMGLGTQMIAWDERFCALLVGEGFRVVRFDNRDTGLLTHLHDAGMPDLSPILTGGTITESPYRLADMADDVLGLCDALEVDRAHIVGASMGGMIAQEFALRHTARTGSLTSVFSTPSPHIGAPTPEAGAALFTPPAQSEQEAGERAVKIYRIIGSPGFPIDEAAIAERGREAYRRANDPAGVARQLVAIHASGDRSARLRSLTVPTLVLHGEVDPLVQLAGGEATVQAVPGARLVTYPGMGHDLPPARWPELVREITTHARAAG